MSLQPRIRYPEAEYSDMKLAVQEKHEFFRGEIYAMGGATFAHAPLVSNVVRHLGTK